MTITKLKLAMLMVTALIVTFTSPLHSQENFQKIGSYEYAQFNGTWYTVINGGKGDIVDTNHLLVQLKDKADISTFDFVKLGLSKLKSVRCRFSDGYYELEIPQKTDPFETAQKLLQTNKFDEIFFNLYFEVDIASNDPLFFDQWNISKAAISQSWEINTGSSNTIVAVIDVGGDYDHEDLIGNRWSGIGYDFYNNDSDPYPSDGGRHGTAVAGIIGAVTNNGLGIAGIAGGWAGSGGIRLMHLRAGYRYWDGQQWRELISISAATQATNYAASNGARVINMSFGGSTPLPILETAINNAINNYGVVIVASAGNYQAGQSTSIGYPAKYNNVISVGATTPSDTRKELNDGTESWWGSCYGPELDIVAPGVYIRTTDLTGSIGYSTNNYYDSFNGTSSAAPHVASLVALIRSINPLLTWQQVRDIIYYTSDDKGTTGFDIEYGYGRINSLRALANAFVQTNSQYTYNEGEMSLSLIQSDYWQGFQGSPAPGIAPGMYRCDRYEAKKTFNPYVETPQGWLLSPEGFSNANPNTCYPWYNRITTDNSVEIKTFFYYIRYGVGGNVNQWVPFDPNPNNLRKASALGKPLYAPVISNLVQNPTPVCRNATTRITSTLSQGNGTLTYNWTLNDAPAGSQIYPHGSYCDIFIGPLADNIDVLPVTSVTLSVSNSAGESILNRTVYVNNGCNGCPTLAFEQNGNLVDENTLLVTSISNPDKDVTDYYLVNTPLAPVNNKINLTIHEPQTEHTWFDNFSLLETRANPDETIVVNDEGQVINYKGILPARIMLNGNIDVTENLLSMDSVVVKLYPGDEITISRTVQSIQSDGDVVLGGEEPPVAKDRPALLLNVLKESKITGEDEKTVVEKVPITNFYFRPNRSIISKKLRNLPTGTIQITVNKELTLDYFVFVTDLRTARTRELPLVTAVHNVNGDIKSKLTGIDQNYAEMIPTQRIDLSFSTTTNSGNRAYILKTVGRYETDTTFLAKQNNLAKLNEQPIIPTENKLYDNYPNPFNPSTIIKYSLKDDGKVTLKIFNSLGEEVRTIVNELKSAGNYEVEFNASILPSGVYIYSIQSGEFVSSKKMILLK